MRGEEWGYEEVACVQLNVATVLFWLGTRLVGGRMGGRGVGVWGGGGGVRGKRVSKREEGEEGY